MPITPAYRSFVENDKTVVAAVWPFAGYVPIFDGASVDRVFIKPGAPLQMTDASGKTFIARRFVRAPAPENPSVQDSFYVFLREDVPAESLQAFCRDHPMLDLRPLDHDKNPPARTRVK